MKLPVYVYGHPVLRKVAEEIDPSAPELKKLVDDMFETMYASEGVGLAAPQIGSSIRLVVIDADPLAENFPECAGRKFVLINPDIEILDGEKITRSEGCLSLPGLSENVPRVEHIRITWDDLEGNEHTEEVSGFLARIIQHECDHLEGKMYIDHVSAIRRQLLRGKLNNLIEGRVRVDYPVKYAPKKRK